ncbi:amidase [Streptosporangium sp. KLBMP 9127]|nr:amidase [Streptosporangium sp. KLBMP 9127]
MSAVDGEIRAWVRVDAEGAEREAARLDEAADPGLLHGLPAGVKDTIDVAGLPTECGSVLRAGRIAGGDAWVVTRLRAAGMIVLGKTVTAEFACSEPGPTRNPHDQARTPGGSSSGSAAAVASGMVPFALGTQTGGSITRPAAFCGIAGYVAPPGAFPMDGIEPLSETLDSVGILARDVADLEVVRAALLGLRQVPALPEMSRPRLLMAKCSELAVLDPGFEEELERVVSLLVRQGARVDTLPADLDLKSLLGAHSTVLTFEAAGALRFEPAERRHLSASLRHLLDLGARTPRGAYERALGGIALQRARALELLSEYDAVLAPAVPGAAPPGRTTGDAVMSRPWQAMGLPVVTVPGLVDHASMPLGLQLVGNPRSEERLFAAGRWLEARLRSRR